MNLVLFPEFGFKTENNLRLGADMSNCYTTTFIAEALLGKNLGLTFKYILAVKVFIITYKSEYLDKKGIILNGANYRHGFKNGKRALKVYFGGIRYTFGKKHSKSKIK